MVIPVDIRCTAKFAGGPDSTTQANSSAFQLKGRAMDPEANEIALALADALPEGADIRIEITAVGILATALIAHARVHERSELVETFCATLRRSVANELS